MYISQHDIAQLTDSQVARMAIDAKEIADSGRPGCTFWEYMARALVRARKERVTLFAFAEFEYINDDGPGAIVEPGSDPIAEGLEEFRRGMSDGPL